MSVSDVGQEKMDKFDVICFCHLRWDFVYQRPQHLMSRFAAKARVFVIEEPVPGDGAAYIDVSDRGRNVFVCVPHVPDGFDTENMAGLVAELVRAHEVSNYITWFYTPMMFGWSKELKPKAVVYDCMDELSAFKNAPPELLSREKALFDRADLVFTGGQSLYEAKRDQHSHVFAFPSSIDTAHFSRARSIHEDISEQAAIPHPRIGFIGVIDERLDIGLLDAISELRPEWSFVMVGPVVKIAQSDLPRRENIYYLGQRSYDELPAIIAGWDAAMMPFALNESTRYISPTKTPEFLAAGRPVVSTPIADVVRPYGERGLVEIASTPQEFVDALGRAMDGDDDNRRRRADEFLSDFSWDKTFMNMYTLIEDAIQQRGRGALAEVA